ncbi:MAG: hypothetical protein LBL70_08665, partial [Treponema sp.]|nr:hypothetical protein [Treponema sp.]
MPRDAAQGFGKDVIAGFTGKIDGHGRGGWLPPFGVEIKIAGNGGGDFVKFRPVQAPGRGFGQGPRCFALPVLEKPSLSGLCWAIMDKLIIKGAREHNLKNIDLELPRDKLIVVSGLSGSGKSSLAFDTIFAEGQRRYV